MTLRGRIDRLTRRLGITQPCPECGADPSLPVHIDFYDEEHPALDTPPCHRCGWPKPITFSIEQGHEREYDDDE